MPAGIGIPQGIVPHIRVAIVILRVERIRHEAVRAEEASQLGRIESRLVMVDSQASDLTLTDLDRLDPAREEFVRVQRACYESRLTEGRSTAEMAPRRQIISLFADDVPAGVGDYGCRAKVILEPSG